MVRGAEGFEGYEEFVGDAGGECFHASIMC